MTLAEAEKIASRTKALVTARKKPRSTAARDLQVLDALLAGARAAATDIHESRRLLALASFPGAREALRAKYRAACVDPAMALKCNECGADQDCCASTCDKCQDTETCGRCGACAVCEGEDDGSSLWVRPAPGEVLSKCISKWETPKPEWKDATSYSRDGDRTPKAWSIKLGAFTLTVLCGHIHCPDRWVAHLTPLWDQRDLELPAPTSETNRAEAQAKALRMAAEVFEKALADVKAAGRKAT